MYKKSLLLAILLTAAIIALWPSTAAAQGPSPNMQWTFDNGSQQGWWLANSSGFIDATQQISTTNGTLRLTLRRNDDIAINHEFYVETITGTISLAATHSGTGNDQFAFNLYGFCDGDEYLLASRGWSVDANWSTNNITYPECMVGATNTIALNVKYNYADRDRYVYLDTITLRSDLSASTDISTLTTSPEPQLCEQFYNFDTDLEGWTPDNPLYVFQTPTSPLGSDGYMRFISTNNAAHWASVPLDAASNIFWAYHVSALSGADNSTVNVYSQCDGTDTLVRSQTLSGLTINERADYLGQCSGQNGLKIYYRHNVNTRYFYVDRLKVENKTCVGSGQIDTGGPTTCENTNANFDTADGWTLTGSAAITDSTLSMGSGDSAAQNVTLAPATEYTVAISVPTTSSATVGLDVALGTESVTLLAVQPGDHSATFTTPAVLAGPLELRITQAGVDGSLVNIDSVCVTPGSGADGPRQCIAPANGDFQSGSFAGPTGWQLFNGASHDTINLRAVLPYSDPDRALIATTSAYTMPTLAEGEYLLLGFTALAEGTAYMASQAGPASFDYEIYEAAYDFESDISAQAGSTIELSFANIGSDGFPATGTAYLDDICIWVSDRPANMTTPDDVDGIEPWRAGWNVGCADVPAVLAGFGINVFALEETYAAGVSVWEFSGWVPWLAAALWVNVGAPVLCMILAMFGWLVGMLEYIVNQGLNWANWGQRSARAASIWLGGGYWNLGKFLETTAANWLTWAAVSAVNAWGIFSTLNIQTAIDWITATGEWLMNGLWYVIQSAIAGSPVSGAQETISNTSSLFSVLLGWLALHLADIIFIPLDFYEAIKSSVDAVSYASLFSCDGGNFWCTLLAGMQLINAVSADTIGYPVVIFGIIVATIWIFWRHIWELLTIRVS